MTADAAEVLVDELVRQPALQRFPSGNDGIPPWLFMRPIAIGDFEAPALPAARASRVALKDGLVILAQVPA